jgi:quinol monooxygenase YgiN
VIIVAGHLFVDPAERAGFLAEALAVMQVARSVDGCVDFHLTADPIDPTRINVFEQWVSVADVEAFRGSGPSSEQWQVIRDAAVFQHEVSDSIQL